MIDLMEQSMRHQSPFFENIHEQLPKAEDDEDNDLPSIQIQILSNENEESLQKAHNDLFI